MTKTLWVSSADRQNKSNLSQFIKFNKQHNVSDWDSLLKWSLTTDAKKDLFWKELITYFEIPVKGSLEPVFTEKKFLEYGWFPNLNLNFAEALLKNGSASDTALDFYHESGLHSRLTYAQLREQVGALQEFLKTKVKKGDVVAAYMPNIPETVVMMLAATGLGCIFTSTSADFGVAGVVDRFEQTKPKVLITVNGYSYNGKKISLKENLHLIKSQLPSLESVVCVDFLKTGEVLDGTLDWKTLITKPCDPVFVEMNFRDPLYIMYSSGTTGKPKCIVHSIGGTLLQHVKELGLHTDLKREKSIFYFTTCGWMMWNWLVSSLFFGSRVVLYEGSPSFPTIRDFFEIINKAKINIFGTSPKFLKALEDSGYKGDFELPTLETILSTGSPLNEEQFDFVYDHVKKDVMLSSIAGGTDILGCFMLGNPLVPVRRGEISAKGLGMDIAVFDSSGNEVVGEEGELVCLQSFPSQPVCFWNDPKNEKYRNSYFAENPKVWSHGDYVRQSETGTFRIFGRSDATLNPGGVRIGTAEIYSVVESFDFITDSLCIGPTYDGDVQVFLFVKTPSGQVTDEQVGRIKNEIKSKLTNRHVPHKIFGVKDIPYTRSGKKMELSVKKIFEDRELTNLEAVANAECIEEYKNLRKKLKSLV